MSNRIRLPAGSLPSWADLREELEVPGDFRPEVVAEGAQAATSPRLPGVDLTGLPFLTIDPLGSRDLDQAMCLERAGAGFLVRYAIADVAAFVRPGSLIDVEAHRRGQTLYAPDLRVPLHPPVLSEGAASLLPDQDTPALVWTIRLGGNGEPLEFHVERAMVRSRRQLEYESVQAALDAGTADDQLQLLRDVGRLREERARDRGAVDLPTPEQEVTDVPGGLPELRLRAPLPVEGWNAEISLLTGMLAARLMLEGGVGLLRTLPPPDPEAEASVRRSARALGVPWPEDADWRAVLSALDPHHGPSAALLSQATRLLRGAGYTVVNAPVTGDVPAELMHAAVAAPYAHCTAPLRRLPDRYVGEVCVALCAGTEVPEEIRAALPALPEEMAASDRRAHALERAVVDLAEAVLLAPRVGETFDAVVVSAGKGSGEVQLQSPPVRARCEGADLPLGGAVRVRLTDADTATRTVRFQVT